MTFWGPLVNSAARIVSADLTRVSCSDSGVNHAACGVTTKPPFEPRLARPVGAQQLGDRFGGRLDRQHIEPGCRYVAVAQQGQQRIEVDNRPRAVLTTTAPLRSEASSAYRSMPWVSG